MKLVASDLKEHHGLYMVLRAGKSHRINGEFEAILKIIEREVEAARERAVDSSVTKKPNARNSTTASLLASGARPEHGTCCYCEQGHQSAHCMKVTDIEEKKSILMKNGRCFVCLKRNHKARECHSSLRCSACGRQHHISICGRSSTGTFDLSKAPQRSKQSSATP